MSQRVGVDAARHLAQRLLEPLSGSPQQALRDRWRHTVGVAGRAAELVYAVDPADREILVATAWLHDIGYAPSIRDSGFHPVDGARFLGREGWPERICALVAHHSGARFVARASGHAEVLGRYVFEWSPVSDALTYADQTIGTHGQSLPLEDRLADMLRRHGPESRQAQVHRDRAPYLRAAAARVHRRVGTTVRP
jgi:hypothetical protein